MRMVGGHIGFHEAGVAVAFADAAAGVVRAAGEMAVGRAAFQAVFGEGGAEPREGLHQRGMAAQAGVAQELREGRIGDPFKTRLGERQIAVVARAPFAAQRGDAFGFGLSSGGGGVLMPARHEAGERVDRRGGLFGQHAGGVGGFAEGQLQLVVPGHAVGQIRARQIIGVRRLRPTERGVEAARLLRRERLRPFADQIFDAVMFAAFIDISPRERLDIALGRHPGVAAQIGGQRGCEMRPGRRRRRGRRRGCGRGLIQDHGVVLSIRASARSIRAPRWASRSQTASRRPWR